MPNRSYPNVYCAGAYAAELLKVNPPHFADEPILAQMQRIGIELGKSLDFDKLDPAVKKALESAPGDAQQLMKWKVPTLARIANGWSMNTDTMGVYGNYYLKRAIVAQLGLGANNANGVLVFNKLSRVKCASRRSAAIRTRTECSFIDPMQWRAGTALPAGEKWTFEIKLDGYRCIRGEAWARGHAILAPQEGAQQALFPRRRVACLARGRVCSQPRICCHRLKSPFILYRITCYL